MKRDDLPKPPLTVNIRAVNDRIVINPEVCSGRPVVRGTRIAVHIVLSFLAAGDGIEDILDGYLSLTREDVLACLEYASEATNTPSVAR